jgi:aspartate racemase
VSERQGADVTKRLGVIGGLGPLATAYFYELIVRMTDAGADQEHIETVIFSKPTIPDRTEYILGKSGKNPLNDMIEAGRKLVGMGADYIAIPCITAHYFYASLSEKIRAPVLHAVKEVAHYLKGQEVRCAGILASEGTIHSGLVQQELELSKISTVVPSGEKQKQLSELIYQGIKANQPIDINLFREITDELKAAGAEVIILGCTELSLIKRDFDLGPGFIDAMEVLAMRAVMLCDARLKEEYHFLITK